MKPCSAWCRPDEGVHVFLGWGTTRAVLSDYVGAKITLQADRAHHPERAIYLLGAEDHGIPASVLDGKRVVQIPAPLPHSMNVAVAGTIVMHDRHAKGEA